MTPSVPSRQGRRTPVKVSAIIMLAVMFAVTIAGTAAWAETTTTVPESTTDTTASGEPALISASSVTPAPEGFEPPNPGLVAADMAVQFWPEYDSNDVLALLDITLPATTVFPYEFTFFVPTGARLAGIAEIDENGQFDYSLGTPQIVTGEVMDAVTVTVPKRPQLRLEWYFDPGIGAPGAKSYDLLFQAPADVGELPVAVQQPKTATGFSAGPDLTQTSTDAQGFVVYYGSFPSIKSGDLVTIPVQYTKTDEGPSIPTGGVSDPAQEQSSNYLLWLLILLVVAVIGIVVYRLFLRKPQAAAPRSTGTRSTKGGAKSGRKQGTSAQRGGKQQPSAGDAGAGPGRFCTQCGGRLSKKDRFCPQCGAERD
jgi:flagellar basal body-associated protein FliL